jgi:two-component system NtrC family response regulator
MNVPATPMKTKLLIVDDDEEIRTQMKWALGSDYEVLLADDREDALAVFNAERPAVVILDLGLPPRPNESGEGLAALTQLLVADRTVKVIIISGQEEKENALQAVGCGAYDFLCKPVDLEELKLLLRRCFYVAKLESEYRQSQQSLGSAAFEGMLGVSPQMHSVFSVISKVAPTHAPVLLLGESGTGKEMAAMSIHRRSACKDGPFVAVNCNAIPENLVESELFGHEKGAFTGAHIQRKGLVETASGGTLFLDEIGDLPPSLQVKLLRFLQNQSFQRVGGRQDLRADTRIIAATNSDLKEALKNGSFREDLYFRLAVVVLTLPPLRQRGPDIALLARELLEQSAAQIGRKNLAFAPDTLKAISLYPWPGNVRELQNRIRRAVILAEGKRLTIDDLELENPSTMLTPPTLKQAREAVEREMVQQALGKHSGKIGPAATELGISRPTFYELMEKLGIQGKAEMAKH